jgi:calcium/calmodulin-dependent 3',5'-cyclic nucleotide phosphodiesterase
MVQHLLGTLRIIGCKYLSQSLDSWDFAIFEAEALTTRQPLRYMGHELFKRHNLFSEHKILPATLDSFLLQVEKGYKSHQNSYHNETHGADVLQTVHALITSAQLDQLWLSSLELLALLLAATIHDVDHPGTTNSFQIKTVSDFALCYNDRSVLENHHLHYSFQLLKNEEYNILQGLSCEEFAEVRGLVIDMVLATDMSSHFEQVKQMRLLLSGPDSVSQLSEEHRSKVMCLLLHTADISHPGKPWTAHRQWTERISEEFFRQGDWERELALPQSPLCDRHTTPLNESRLGFIDYIVSPLFDVCGDMLELLSSSAPPGSTVYSRPWLINLTHNRQRWLSTTHTENTPGIDTRLSSQQSYCDQSATEAEFLDTLANGQQNDFHK